MDRNGQMCTLKKLVTIHTFFDDFTQNCHFRPKNRKKIRLIMHESLCDGKKCVTVLFDRAGRAPILGKGKIEIRIYLSRTVRKYIVMGDCTVKGWQFYPKSKKLKEKCEEYEEIIRMMKIRGDELTIENFNKYVEGGDKSKQDPLGKVACV